MADLPPCPDNRGDVMSDRWDDLRFNAADGEWATRPLGDMRRCLADLLAERDDLAAEVERLRGAMQTAVDRYQHRNRIHWPAAADICARALDGQDFGPPDDDWSVPAAALTEEDETDG